MDHSSLRSKDNRLWFL